MIGGGETGQCWICGAVATVQCDHAYRWQDPDQQCTRWLCWEHVTVEAQPGDAYGADGVDIRCSDHTAPPATVTRA